MSCHSRSGVCQPVRFPTAAPRGRAHRNYPPGCFSRSGGLLHTVFCFSTSRALWHSCFFFRFSQARALGHVPRRPLVAVILRCVVVCCCVRLCVAVLGCVYGCVWLCTSSLGASRSWPICSFEAPGCLHFRGLSVSPGDGACIVPARLVQGLLMCF